MLEEAAELGATAVDAVAGVVTDAAEEVAHAVEAVAEEVGAAPGKSSGVSCKVRSLLFLRHCVLFEFEPRAALRPTSIDADPAQEGDMLPKGIKLQNQDGDEVDLDSAFAAAKYTVIFCYPKASTGGCTNQACAFRDSFSEVRQSRRRRT